MVSHTLSQPSAQRGAHISSLLATKKGPVPLFLRFAYPFMYKQHSFFSLLISIEISLKRWRLLRSLTCWSVSRNPFSQPEGTLGPHVKRNEKDKVRMIPRLRTLKHMPIKKHSVEIHKGPLPRLTHLYNPSISFTLNHSIAKCIYSNYAPPTVKDQSFTRPNSF